MTIDRSLVLHLKTTRKSSSEIARLEAGVAVGDTPIVEILGGLTAGDSKKVRFFGKCEFLNNGGSVKDRLALAVVKQFLRQGGRKKYPAGLFEGTVGSTGISLALLCNR